MGEQLHSYNTLLMMQEEGYDVLLSASDYQALKSQIQSKKKMIREQDLQNEKLKVEVMRVMQEGDKKTKICRQMQVKCAKEIFKLSQIALQQQTELEARQKCFDNEVKQLQSQIEKSNGQNQGYLATISKIERKSAQCLEKAAIIEQKWTELQAQNQSIMRQLQDFKRRNIVLEQKIEQRDKVIQNMQEKVREAYAGGKCEAAFEQLQFSSLQSEKEEAVDKARMEQKLQQTEKSKRTELETESMLREIAYLKEVNIFLQNQNEKYQRVSRRQVDVNTVVQNSRKILEGSKANLQACEMGKKEIKQHLLRQKNEMTQKIQEVFDAFRFY